MYLRKSVNYSSLILQKNIFDENLKLQTTKEKLLLVEDLNKTIFSRLFKVTRDIIVMQKLIFETYLK